MFASIRRYFISGLLVWIPIWVTLLVINFMVQLLNNIYIALPKRFQIETYLGFHVPGIGMVIVLLIIFLTGMLAANFFGRHLLNLWDRIMSKIPLVRSIHAGVKQVLNTLFSPQGESFRKVFLVEYPRKGMWCLAFQTGLGGPEVNEKMQAKEVLTLFVPTTPNPTSGFIIMVPKEDAMELKMTVDQAMRFIISLGVVQPHQKSIHDAATTFEL